MAEQEVPVTAEEVEAAYRIATERHDRERLLAIHLWLQQDMSVRRIAGVVMRGRATVCRWIRAFREGGIPGLLRECEHKGRRPTPSVKALIELDEGLVSGRWKTAKEIKAWLEEEHHVKLTLSGVHYWLGRLRSSLKVPQTSHVEKHAEEVEAFKEQFVQKMTALGVPQEKTLYIWVEDEHRYGLNTITRRVWTAKGLRPVVPYQKKREYADLYGALEVGTGKAEFLHVPSVSLEWTRAFLEQLAATDPEGIHVVIWDGAGWHPLPDDPGLPEGIRIIELPAYSPELNPAEALWPEVKKAAANVAWQTVRQVEDAINGTLKRFWESVERVCRLLGHNWTARAATGLLGHPCGLTPN